MRTLGVFLVLAAILTIVPTAAAAQCGPFSTGAECRVPAGPRLHLDFGSGLKPAPPARPRTFQPIPVRLPAAPPQADPIDCAMVRWADPSIDPQFVKRPDPTVKHTMRVIEVPACPAGQAGQD